MSLAQPLLRAYQEQSSLAGGGGVGGGGGGGGGRSADGRRDVLQEEEEAGEGGGGKDANTLAFQSLVDAAKLAYGARPDARRQTSLTTLRTTAARADACTTTTEEIDDAPVTDILGVLGVRGAAAGGDWRGESGQGNVSGVADCGGGGSECASSATAAELKSGYTASWLGSYLWKRQESEADATQPETLQTIPPPQSPKRLI